MKIRSQKPFNALLYGWYCVRPWHQLEGLDTDKFYDWDFWEHPVGSGPYRYVRHVPDTMVELEANPDYYGGKPQIEHVLLKFGNNPLPELLGGNVDAVKDISPFTIQKIKKSPEFNRFYEFKVRRVYGIEWNHRNPLFQSASVRRVLTHAINREELKLILDLPASTSIFDAAIYRGQIHGGEVPQPLPYDLKQANHFLEESGWSLPEKAGIREKNGREFRLSLIVSPELQTVAVYVQDQLGKAGIRVKINTI